MRHLSPEDTEGKLFLMELGKQISAGAPWRSDWDTQGWLGRKEELKHQAKCSWFCLGIFGGVDLFWGGFFAVVGLGFLVVVFFFWRGIGFFFGGVDGFLFFFCVFLFGLLLFVGFGVLLVWGFWGFFCSPNFYFISLLPQSASQPFASILDLGLMPWFMKDFLFLVVRYLLLSVGRACPVSQN